MLHFKPHTIGIRIMANQYTHANIQEHLGNHQFVVLDNVLNEFWGESSTFTSDKAKAKVFNGKFDTDAELKAFNNGCSAHTL